MLSCIVYVIKLILGIMEIYITILTTGKYNHVIGVTKGMINGYSIIVVCHTRGKSSGSIQMMLNSGFSVFS